MDTQNERTLGPGGRFVLAEVLGKGGNGIVHRAFDRQHDAEVALKILTRPDPLILYFFKREFRELSGVTHPRLVQLYELFAEGDTWFFTMELVDGVSLLEWTAGTRDDEDSTELDQATETLIEPTDAEMSPAPASRLGPRADLGRLRPALRGLAEGVRALHIARRLHLDLKPSNVMVRRDGSVVLLDFGLARRMHRHPEEPSAVIAGTPSYMAPEQVQGMTPSEATDWYALGVILYRALSGRLPFGGSPSAVLEQKVRDDPLPPSVFHPDAPADLEELCMALLRRDPRTRPDESTILGTLGGAGITGAFAAMAHGAPPAASTEIFVGRGEELGTLEAALNATREDRAAVCFVSGRSGMGKSALLRRFVDQAIDTRPRPVVLTGRCYEEESVPYKGTDDVVDGLARYLAALPDSEVLGFLPPGAAELARLFPVLRRVGPLAREPGSSPVDQVGRRREAFLAFREILGRLARRRRVILHIDDIHWSDADSVALLLELLRPPDPPPVLLVASHRPLERGRALPLRRLKDQLAHWPLIAREVELGPLADDALRDLAGDLGVEDVDAAVAKCDGSPYFLAELAEHAGGQADLDEGIRARVAELEEGARLLVEVACVAGHPIDTMMATRAAGGSIDPSRTVAELKALRILRAGGEGDRIEPYHDRIREAVVASLPEERRVLHHRALALELERRGGDPVLRVRHLLRCGELTRAGEQAERAAEDARELLAFERAAELYEVAIDARAHRSHLDPTGPLVKGTRPSPRTLPTRMVELRRAHAECLAHAGHLVDAGQAFVRAAEAAEEEGSEASDAQALRRRGAALLLSGGASDAGRAAAREAMAAVGLRMPRTRLGAILSFAWSDFGIRSLEPAGADELTRRRIDTLSELAIGLASRSPVLGASLMAKAAKIATRSGDAKRALHTLAIHVASVAAFDPKRAKKLSRFLDAKSDVEEPYTRALISAAGGYRDYFDCRWRASLQSLDRAEEILRRECRGVAYELQWVQAAAGFDLGWLGEYEELARRLPVQIREAQDRGDRDGAATLFLSLGWLTTLAADDPQGLLTRADQVYEELDEDQRQFKDFYYAICKITGLSVLGRHRDALDFVASREKSLARAGLFRIRVGHALWVGGRAAQHIGAAHEDPANAAEHLRQAERDQRTLRGIDVAYARAYEGLIAAGIALARGDEARAIASLEGSEQSLSFLDTHGMAQGARWIRGQMMGGDEGDEVRDSAARWLQAKGVRDPGRFTQMWLPRPR